MDFTKALQEELNRLDKLHADLLAQRGDIDAKLKKCDDEIRAIKAYEDAKLGKKPEKKTRAPRKTGIRTAVLNMIASTPGVTRSQLLELMQAKGDKKQEQAISNAVAALKKAGTLTAADGVYTKT